MSELFLPFQHEADERLVLQAMRELLSLKQSFLNCGWTAV